MIPSDPLPIPFTAIVVTYNEETHLRDCLKSLSFCEKQIIIDLGSSDSSIKIAKQFGAEVIHHKRVPIVERILEESKQFAETDWIIFLDPDEIFPPNIEAHLQSMISGNSNIGLIKIPWRFYFKGNPVTCTVWGLEKAKGVVVHKDRMKFNPTVHQGYDLLLGYRMETLKCRPRCFIKHYWADSYRHLFKKHWRYIKHEGEARHIAGQRFSWTKYVMETLVTLKYNLIDYGGISGGGIGVFLSFFYTWYINMSLLSLYCYQKKNANIAF